MKNYFGIMIAILLICLTFLLRPISAVALSNEYSQFNNSLSNYSEEELFDLLVAISNELKNRRKAAGNSNPTQPVLSEDKDYSKEEIDAIVNEILQYKNRDTEKALKLIKEYSEYMTDGQLKSTLLSYGKFESFNKAVEKLKTYLKSPRSFRLYDGSVYSPVLQEDGSYKVQLEIEYGATNSFGAEITENVTMYATIVVDLQNVSVDFKDVDLSPYDKWAMYN